MNGRDSQPTSSHSRVRSTPEGTPPGQGVPVLNGDTPEGAVQRELDATLELLRDVVSSVHWPRALFLTGSAVTGEWAATRGSDGWRFFSDLDLGVVADTRVPDAERVLRDTIRERVRLLSADRDWSGPPEVNIAFFTEEELRSQAPKPGTLEMINQAKVVWGDRDVRLSFPPITAEDLTWEESIRLLGNRVLELLAHPPGEHPELIDYFRLAKLFCDLPTALLVPEGAYVSGYRKRADRLPALLGDRALPPKLHRSRNALIEAVEFWTEFRFEPSVEKLQARYAAEPLGEEGRALHGGVWTEARRLLEACLEALMPHRLLDADGRPEPSALGRSSGWGSLRSRVREWRWLANYADGATLHVWKRGVGVAFRLSPVEITYLTAFILFLRSVDGPPPVYIDPDLVRSLERWYPLPHDDWTSGESVREGVVRLWRYWLPRI